MDSIIRREVVEVVAPPDQELWRLRGRSGTAGGPEEETGYWCQFSWRSGDQQRLLAMAGQTQ